MQYLCFSCGICQVHSYEHHQNQATDQYHQTTTKAQRTLSDFRMDRSPPPYTEIPPLAQSSEAKLGPDTRAQPISSGDYQTVPVLTPAQAHVSAEQDAILAQQMMQVQLEDGLRSERRRDPYSWGNVPPAKRAFGLCILVSFFMFFLAVVGIAVGVGVSSSAANRHH